MVVIVILSANLQIDMMEHIAQFYPLVCLATPFNPKGYIVADADLL